MLLVFSPEVLTHLLTPIFPYLYMTCVRWRVPHIGHFWHFWHKWHIQHWTFVISRYGNMGVKSCARISGIQTNPFQQLWSWYYQNTSKKQSRTSHDSLKIQLQVLLFFHKKREGMSRTSTLIFPPTGSLGLNLYPPFWNLILPLRP